MEILKIRLIQNIFEMAKKSLANVKEEFKDYGFDPAVIEIAYANVDGNTDRIMDEIFRLQSESSAYPTKPATAMDEDAQLSKAIELSMNEAKDKKISLEPLNPEQRIRKSGVPVGLKNIGNTCYFNSLLQTYFQNTNFVRVILAYQIPKKYVGIKDEDIQKHLEQDFEFKRKLASCRLVQNLKQLFCSLIASDRKYIDPTPVISSIVDDYGNDLAIGDQKDIGEFNLVFLSRIEDGLEESRQEKHMEIEVKKSDKQQDEIEESPSKINVFGNEQSSLLRRSSIRIRQQSIIADQFIGKIQHTFLNGKENINKTEEQLFSLLFVNVKHRELYKACEEITISHIDDYRNEKGEVIGVEKHSWIKEAPKTLFFQIDRVTYDKASQTLQKVNDLFDFPTTFYIDPFLQKNKEQALKIQFSVRSLRKDKEKYLQALESIYKYGEKEMNLLELLGQTEKFLVEQKQQMEVEREVDNPIFIPQLSNEIKPQFSSLLRRYRENIQDRVDNYKNKIEAIDKQIEKAYAAINHTPYYLYSILIHEGGADSGHYYSYTYDHQLKKWRKYNDINITEEVEEQVLKQAKGINVTSAYYLVYAQRQVLIPHGLQGQKLCYKLSNEEEYMHDLYSSFLSLDQRNAVVTDNNHMYYDIEQYKMNSFATRVVDVYAKKFESFNEIYRKTKIEKKKNSPPLLTSLPVYVKSIDEEEYKNTLLQQAILQYGPKEPNIVFEDLLKKKLGNFHDFKRPKKFFGNEKFVQGFISNYCWAIAARKLFQSMQKQQYDSLFTLIKHMLRSDNQEYFNWLARILLKTFVVRFLAEAQLQIKEKPEVAIQKLKLIVIIFGKYINKEDERMLHINSIFWINQLLADHQHLKESLEEILSFLDDKKYEDQYADIEYRNETCFTEIEKSLDLADAMWNSSRQENIVINAMLQNREKVKSSFEPCNKLYSEMKKVNVPLSKAERDRILKA